MDSTNDTQVTQSTPSQCSQCTAPATFMCSSCGLNGPRYCSDECQKTHWKVSHYKTCEATKEARRFRAARDSQTGSGSLTMTGRGSNRQRNRADCETQDQERPSHIGADIPLQDLNAETRPNTNDETDDDRYGDDLKFYMHQIYLIIKPVVVCIVLSIFWVKVSFSGQSDYSPTRPTYAVLAPNTGSGSSSTGTSSGSTGGSVALNSLANAAIIIGQIIVVTIIIVFIFKKGWIKILVGFFMIVVVGLLGFMSYLLLLNLIQVFYIPLDYITLALALWNFAMVGLVSIFWKGPLWLQQSYLTIMSSLMAFSLTGLEQWTTWILLGLLAVWDLIAVLCPFGPLRLLIESSKTQQREVPALLYSVNAVWFMVAPNDHFRLSTSMTTSSTTITTPEPTLSPFLPEFRRSRNLTHSSFANTFHSFSNSSEYEASTSSIAPLQQNSSPISRDLPSTASLTSTLNNTKTEPDSDLVDAPDRVIRTNDDDTDSIDEEDAERSGLKLGLGDFVFYSVLVARAAMYDWITTVCCTVAVLTGLTTTIFLLAIYKKALPALPISIAFGILFYFVAKTVLVPYIGALCVFGMVGL
ncbi:Presenilin-domain-containing protein [Phycomyces nitens]|nr:Presenilin-domain-containing protein [Phycomyces nitens]